MPESNANLVEVRGLRFSQPGRLLFDGIDLDIPRGRITAIMGPSGTGKTTLLRMMGGQIRPQAGSLRLNGEEIVGAPRRRLYAMRRRMGMLFQNGALLDSMTVLENVGLPLREHTNQEADEIAERVSRVLTAVGLEDVEPLLPRELSGGMLRRVAFARAIVMEPEILLCDEPFSGLDPLNVTRIEELLMRLNRDLGLTVVITSHHMATSLRMSDQMILLRDMNCVAGTAEELVGGQDQGVIEFLGEDGAAYLARLHELQDAGPADGAHA